MAATSFASEHTVEFFLIPKLVRVLKEHFRSAVPFYFWATREGGRLSDETAPDEPVRVLTVFPRRPKLETALAEQVTVRFNESLFETSACLTENGMPVFAGVPLARSLVELESCEVAWFHLPGFARPLGTVDLHLSLDGREPGQATARAAIDGPLSDEQLLDRVRTLAERKPWWEIVETIRECRRASQPASGFRWFAFGYKPFQVLLIDD